MRVVRSLRFRVTVSTTVLVLAVLVAVSAALVSGQRSVQVENLDESLASVAGNVSEALAAGETLSGVGGFHDDDDIVQVVDADGRVVASTSNVEGRPPVVDAPAVGTERRTTQRGLLNDQARFRVLARHDAGGAALIVAASLDDVDHSVEALRSRLFLIVPLVTALFGVIVWWVVGRTLRPVEAIRAEVAGIGGEDLDRRVPESDSGDEIARLAHTMNEMLARVEDAKARQDRFVADASHELRSPLTRIRADLETDLAGPGCDLQATHRRVLGETIELEQLVDDLLQLARTSPGASPVAKELVDLDDLALDAGRQIRGRRPEVTVDTSSVSAAQVRGDRAALRRAIGNLVENADRHARSVVRVAVGEFGGAAQLSVADDGPGIPLAERERIFERFARVDGSRDRDGGGTGLGLAIARDIVQRHGGTLTVDTDADAGAGARFVIELPLA
jgi:signal transduction histidine kinase